MVTDLGSRWPLGDDLTEVRDELVAAYATDRGYHDTRHLAEVLDRIEELHEAGEDFDHEAVTLAAWFHDAVYDGRAGAEERSAQWARRALAGLPVADEVARLVRLTERHPPTDDDTNGCVLSDADLAILAARPERYTEYIADVRREYAHVPDDLFRPGRAAVLRDLLAKRSLFHTAHARKHWEDRARANVEAESTALRLSGFEARWRLASNELPVGASGRQRLARQLYRQNGWPAGSSSTRTSSCGWSSASVAPSSRARSTAAARSVTSMSRCSCMPCLPGSGGHTGGSYTSAFCTAR